MDVDGDFLIIGSGIAGLRAAVELSEAGNVIVLTKAEPAESNTGYAQNVNIPDAKFKAYCIKNFDTNNDSIIQASEDRKSTRLNSSH